MNKNIEKIDIYKEVIDKLIGRVNPVGETHTDNERKENLKNLIELYDYIGMKLFTIAEDKESHMWSIKESGILAYKQLLETQSMVSDLISEF